MATPVQPASQAESDSSPKSILSKAVNWFFRQNNSTIISLGMLLLIGVAIREIVKIEIPKHLTQIQSGYERIIDKNNEANAIRDQQYLAAMKIRDEQHTATIKYLSDTFNHNIDRLEKSLDRQEKRQ